MSKSLLLAISLAVAAGAALAQQYRWVDKDGKVHYTDTPPPPTAKDVVTKKAASPRPGTAVVPFELEKAQKESPVTLYTHPTCTDTCQFARNVLNRRGVPFNEVVVATNKALEELKALSGNNHVPVLTVGTRIEKDVSEASYNAALDAGGYPKAGILPARTQAAPDVKPEQMETAGPVSKPAAEKPSPTAAAPSTPLGPYAPGAAAPKPAAKPAAKAQ